MRNQQGAALIVVLSLLTASLMLGLTSMQSSMIDERLAGNYKAASQAQMGAEKAASLGWENLTGNFKNVSDFDWNGSSESSGDGNAIVKSSYAYLKGSVLPDVVGGNYILARGEVVSAGKVIAEREVLVEVKGESLPSLDAFFSCFGSDCTYDIDGHVNGDDHPLPSDFDCKGRGCHVAELEEGEGVQNVYILSEGDENFDDKKAAWEEYLAGLPPADVVYSEGKIHEDIGGRGSPKVIEVTGEVKMNGNASTNGVIVIKDGASLTTNGTAHHEGMIIVEEGGSLNLSNGNFTLYGGIVDLLGNPSVDGPGNSGDPGYDLQAGGNAYMGYSSLAIAGLSSLGARIASWKDR